MAAKAKSPAELKSEGEKLKTLFAKVKKKEHNCAVLMAKDGIVVEAHLKKSPEMLMKAAKKAGGLPKGAWGTMTVAGKVISINPLNDKVPSSLAKQAKKFFSDRGLGFRLEITEPEAEGAKEASAAKSTAQDTPSAGTKAGGAAAAETDDQRDAVTARRDALQAQIEILDADRENVMNPVMNDALSAYRRALEAENYGAATAALTTLDSVFEDYDRLLAEKTPLVERMAAMLADAEQVKRGNNAEASDQISRNQREFDFAIARNEWSAAAEKLDAIEKLTKAHSSANTETATKGTESAPEAGKSADAPPEGRDESADNQDAKAELAQWLDKAKPDINQLLKNKTSKHNKDLIKQLGAYQKALKAGAITEAKQALSEVATVLKAHAADKKKSAEKKAAIFDEMKNIEKKLAKLVPHISI